MNVDNKDEWRLKSLTIDFMEWGDYRGKYVGKIKFSNKQQEAFSFNIPQDKSDQLLALIKESLVDSAINLGDRISKSMPSLEAPKTIPIG